LLCIYVFIVNLLIFDSEFVGSRYNLFLLLRQYGSLNFTLFPPDVQNEILSLIGVSSLVNFSCTNKQHNELVCVNSNLLWRHLYRKQFGVMYPNLPLRSSGPPELMTASSRKGKISRILAAKLLGPREEVDEEEVTKKFPDRNWRLFFMEAVYIMRKNEKMVPEPDNANNPSMTKGDELRSLPPRLARWEFQEVLFQKEKPPLNANTSTPSTTTAPLEENTNQARNRDLNTANSTAHAVHDRGELFRRLTTNCNPSLLTFDRFIIRPSEVGEFYEVTSIAKLENEFVLPLFDKDLRRYGGSAK
jgi:hypothetical protein